ncbi:MAG: ABC transporter ATP-binding protein, partial [Candidatus Electrothrix sp. MAN1_4]|nr:ABC transporter ATP-binding protein [Candidatus Electrothrix sp. MAN1_4]
QFVANIVIATCLVITLLLINPLVAVSAAVLLGGAYFLVYTVLRKYLSRIGAERVKANQQRFQIAQEALGGIKEVKAAGLEAGYMNSFGKPARRFAECQAANIIIGQIPRFVLQALAFGGLLAIVLVMLATHGGDLGQVLPVLGVFAFAGQRLLPALQKIYQNATTLRFGKPALDALHADLSEENNEPLKSAINVTPLPLQQNIELANIGFTYPGASQAAIHDLTLKIPANSTVGFVGSTGAGKTTLVDIIMALLPPDHGQLLVDEQPIFEEHNNPASTVDNAKRNTYNVLKQWQHALGYVPQQIFLAV